VFGRMDAGGYTAFNAFSSIATVILGIIGGETLRRSSLTEMSKVKWLLLAGIGSIVLGLLLSPVIPVVKRIWTPSWVIFSGGWAYLLLALFYWVIEVLKIRRWSFIFMVIGMNSISMYLFFQMMRGSVNGWLGVFTGWALNPLGVFGVIVQSVLVLAVNYYVVLWLYKRNIFLKVG
jgi:heparan-alpha-glucosaminide N-acetyltransferase